MIGVAAAAADTHAIDRRGGWPDLSSRWVTELWCSATGPGSDTVGALPAEPSVIVVGFTGGREQRDSRLSGVVRVGHAVADATQHSAGVSVLLYNNAEWHEASRDVVEQMRSEPVAPLVVAYGHSLGAGAITRFARQLERENIDIDLAVYIDAFGLRNPRLPANIRHAVNFYQRAGLLRGLPLRGKRHLRPESPEATTLLGSYRLAPDTRRFGWHWNLIQPLFYRQHHRLAHDARIQELLVSVAAPAVGHDNRCARAARPTRVAGADVAVGAWP